MSKKRRALAVGAVLAAGSASSATFTVTNLNDSGTGSLRDAIAKANALAGADTIAFQPGLTGTIHLTSGELHVIDSVTINGPGQAVVTISGESSSRVFNLYAPAVNINNLTLTNGFGSQGGAVHAMGATNGPGQQLTLDHLTVTGSTADLGGGIGVFNALSLTISASTISGNTAVSGGGGGVNAGGTISITNTTISGNTATVGSGGGASLGGSLTITDSVITGNTCQVGSGGGMSVAGPQFTMLRTSIMNNTASNDGGGLDFYAKYTSAYLNDDTISGNTSGASGGGIHARVMSAFTIKSALISNNNATAGQGGGASLTTLGLSTVTDSVFSGNVAAEGGGLQVNSPYAEIDHSTFAGNTAGVGGGAFVYQNATFDDVTITNNSATSSTGLVGGGGVYVRHNATFNGTTVGGDTTAAGNKAKKGAGGIEGGDVALSAVTLYDSIVANNTTASGTNPDFETPLGATTTSTWSLIKTPGATNILLATGDITGVDPFLAPLADNGSTILAGNPNSGQVHPQTLMPIAPGSPVINAGDPAKTAASGETDERGKPRVAGGRVDMGAVEVPAIVTSVPALGEKLLMLLAGTLAAIGAWFVGRK